MQKIIFFLSVIGFINSANAESCVTAKVTEATSCSDAKVQFAFDACEKKSEPMSATKVECKGNDVVATLDSADQKLQVSFEKIDKGWGPIEWKSSAVTESGKGSKKSAKKTEVAAAPVATEKAAETAAAEKKEKPAKKAKKVDAAATIESAINPSTAAKPEVKVKAEAKQEAKAEPKQEAKKAEVVTAIPAPAPATPAAAPAAEKEGVLKVNAFGDFRYTALAKDSRATVSGRPESGFMVEDAAIYVNYQKDMAIFYLDVPFRRSKATDSNASAQESSANSNFAFGLEKAQAYVKYANPNGFEFTFGQFDAIIGFEANDSKDRFFSRPGYLSFGMLPYVHVGALMTYTKNGGYIKLVASNPVGKGSLANSDTGDVNTEYGGALGYSNESFRIQASGLTRPIKKASGLENGAKGLFDFLLGFTKGNFSVDFEYTILNDDNKNTLTPSNSTDTEAPGKGYMVLMTYAFNDKWSAGLRYDQLENDPALESLNPKHSITAGFHYKWNSQFETRVDHMRGDYKTIGQTDTLVDNRFAISNVVTF